MDTRYGPVKLKVPTGLPVLLQRFAREVIREQPDDIAEFGATFFQTLVIERKVTGDDPLAGDPYDKPGFHAPPAKALRPISSKTRQEEIKRGQAATKIQAGYRGYRTRKTSTQYRKREETRQQERAATKIQAQYRGYRTRKSVSQPAKKDDAVGERIEDRENVAVDDTAPKSMFDDAAEEVAVDEKSPKSMSDDPADDVAVGDTAPKSTPDDSAGDEQSEKKDSSDEAAAVKIQATYRGYRSRKQMRATIVTQPQGNSNEEAGQEAQDALSAGSPAMSSVADKPSDGVTDKEAGGELASEQGAEPQDNTAEKGAVENKDNLEASQEFEQKDEKLEELPDDREDMEAAAVKIQATFRGHKARKQLKGKKEVVDENENADDTNPIVNSDESAESPSSPLDRDDESQDKVDGVSSAQPVEPATGHEEKVLDEEKSNDTKPTAYSEEAAESQHSPRDIDEQEESTDKSDDVSAAPTLTQDEEKHEKAEEEAEKSEQPVMDSSDGKLTSEASRGQAEDVEPLTGDDKESDNAQSEAAALKIQSTYRGHVVRKQLKENKQQEKAEEKKEKSVQPVLDSSDDKLPSEATRDQADDVEPVIGDEKEVDGDETANKESGEANAAAGSVSQNDSEQNPQEDSSLSVADKVQSSDEAGSESPTEVAGDGGKDKERAAVKIQSSYRGYRARKQLKQ